MVRGIFRIGAAAWPRLPKVLEPTVLQTRLAPRIARGSLRLQSYAVAVPFARFPCFPVGATGLVRVPLGIVGDFVNQQAGMVQLCEPDEFVDDRLSLLKQLVQVGVQGGGLARPLRSSRKPVEFLA